MSFRRPKRAAADARRWRSFVATLEAEFAAAAIPVAARDHYTFDDLLMHGFLPMPGGLADGVLFDVDKLDAGQRLALGRLVRSYLDQFEDPGVDTTILLLMRS